MSILIAFLGGMLTLLSPCTLPVIPLLFASVRGRRGQLAIMLAGMALMFGAVSWLVTVASGWVVNLTLAGRGLALAFFALVGLSLLSQRVAQRLTSPLVALGNQLNDASSRQRGWIILCWPGWRWACCGRRAPGRYWGRYLAWALCIRGRRLPAACCWPTAAAGR